MYRVNWSRSVGAALLRHCAESHRNDRRELAVALAADRSVARVDVERGREYGGPPWPGTDLTARQREAVAVAAAPDQPEGVPRPPSGWPSERVVGSRARILDPHRIAAYVISGGRIDVYFPEDRVLQHGNVGSGADRENDG